MHRSGRTADRGQLALSHHSSCIQAMYQLDGTHIVTIEGLTPIEGLSPIQQAMVDRHASQCGYCTPGMITALEGIFETHRAVDSFAVRPASREISAAARAIYRSWRQDFPLTVKT